MHDSSVTNSRRQGFTLVEVLMAVSVAVILITIAYIVVAQMQSGIRRSIQRTQLSLAGQALDNRIRLDAKAMLGPNSTLNTTAGAIVIVPALREGYVPIRGGKAMSAQKVRLRCDQLAFVTDTVAASSNWTNTGSSQGKKWLSLMPSNLHAKMPAESTQGLVWYGAIRNKGVVPSDGTSSDAYYQAQNWSLGRQLKLLTGGTLDLTQLGVTSGNDCAPGAAADLATSASASRTLTGVDDSGNPLVVRGPNWTADDYLKYMAVDPTKQVNVAAGASASGYANFQNLPVDQIDLDVPYYKVNPVVNASKGLQLSDVAQASLRLFDHCSEVVVQWAGDLDKDGVVDTYPAGHPLAGGIVWYPEEIHDHGSWYNGRTAQMDPAAAVLYTGKISPNRWTNNYPTGFTGPAASRFGGHGDSSATWYQGFQLEYGEQDNLSGQAAAVTRNLPAPYVFRFDDDQYRKVRYGFRQDGSVYRNGCDGNPVPEKLAGGRHHFPYPPSPGNCTGDMNMENPDPAAMYANQNPPAGPYPIAASMTTDPAAGTPMPVASTLPTTNFASAMGCNGPNVYPASGNGGWQRGMLSISPTPFGTWWTWNAVKLPPSASYPGGRSMLIQYWIPQSGQKIASKAVGLFYVQVGGDTDTTTYPSVTIFDPSASYRSEALPGYPNGRLLVIAPSTESGFSPGAMAGNQITNTGWFQITLGGAATGTETQKTVMSYSYMAASFGKGNNYIANYADICAEWLSAINNPKYYGTRADWRNPQSDWPKLIRMKVRLHDAQGELTTWSDDFLTNGRDDDGDGLVDNPTEAKMSGIWYEFVFAVPYPRDPTPHTNTR